LLIDQPDRLLLILFVAMLLDALIGDPPWLWSRLPHPIVLIGRVISGIEGVLLRDEDSMPRKRRRGMMLVGIVLFLSGGLGWVVHQLAATTAHGWVFEALLAAVLLAQRSLYDHVITVAKAMDEGIGPARRAVSMIVGRDPESLDEHAVGRAAIESTAENFSDGVIAPLFWGLLLGLPGILGYKAINTMDSMIGHKSPRYLAFGWAAARLDDLVNLPASRLSAGLAWVAAVLMPGASPGNAWRTVQRDAKQHRSPNAGWPEAAFAGALGIRLAGPRSYGGVPSVGSWIGGGRAEVTAHDVRRSLLLLWIAWSVAGAAIGLAWLAVRV
jgi:adenosylcobinamide-phosphate synthase